MEFAVLFVFVGFLQSMDEFNIPAIISVVSNGILITYLLVFNHRFGIVGVAIAMVIGWLTQVLVQLPSAKKMVSFTTQGLIGMTKDSKEWWYWRFLF